MSKPVEKPKAAVLQCSWCTRRIRKGDAMTVLPDGRVFCDEPRCREKTGDVVTLVFAAADAEPSR